MDAGSIYRHPGEGRDLSVAEVSGREGETPAFAGVTDNFEGVVRGFAAIGLSVSLLHYLRPWG
jgi:hypothetical protein